MANSSGMMYQGMKIDNNDFQYNDELKDKFRNLFMIIHRNLSICFRQISNFSRSI